LQIDGTGWPPDDNPRQSVIQNMKKRHGLFGPKRSDSLDEGNSSKTNQLTQVTGYRELLERAQMLQHQLKSDKLKPDSTKPKMGEPDRKFSDFLSSLTQKRRPENSRPETGSSSSDSCQEDTEVSRTQDPRSRIRDSRRSSLSTIPDTDRESEYPARSMGLKKLAPIQKPSIKIDETPRVPRTQPLLKEKGELMNSFFLLLNSLFDNHNKKV
jgi:hypothetical protein